jgi:multidrug resistance efflux pump
MALDLTVMRKRLEEKQTEIQQHIATLTGSTAQPEDAIQASDGVVEPEEAAVDLEETDVEQAILDMGRMVSVSIAGSQSPKNG